MANPGVSGSQIPAGEDFAQRQIKDLQRELRELGPSIAKSFQPVIDRLDAADIAMATRVADIAANVASINTLIGNEVKPQKVYFTATHTLTTTTQTVATSTFTVPAGFTSAVVSVAARAGGVNQNTTGGGDGSGGDYLTIILTAGAAHGGGYLWVPGNGGNGECVALAADILTGLTPGGTFTISMTAVTDYFTWTTGAYATVSGTILWLR